MRDIVKIVCSSHLRASCRRSANIRFKRECETQRHPFHVAGLMSYDQSAASGAAGGMVQTSQLYMHFDPSNTGGIADLQAVRSSAGGMLPVQQMGGAGSTAGSPQPATQPYSLPIRVHTAGSGIYGPVQPGGQQQAATPAGGLPPATTFYQQQAFAMFPTASQPLPLAMPLANLNNQTPFGTAVASGGNAIGGLISSWQPTPSPGGTKMKTPMPAGAFPVSSAHPRCGNGKCGLFVLSPAFVLFCCDSAAFRTADERTSCGFGRVAVHWYRPPTSYPVEHGA